MSCCTASVKCSPCVAVLSCSTEVQHPVAVLFTRSSPCFCRVHSKSAHLCCSCCRVHRSVNTPVLQFCRVHRSLQTCVFTEAPCCSVHPAPCCCSVVCRVHKLQVLQFVVFTRNCNTAVLSCCCSEHRNSAPCSHRSTLLQTCREHPTPCCSILLLSCSQKLQQGAAVCRVHEKLQHPAVVLDRSQHPVAVLSCSRQVATPCCSLSCSREVSNLLHCLCSPSLLQFKFVVFTRSCNTLLQFVVFTRSCNTLLSSQKLTPCCSLSCSQKSAPCLSCSQFVVFTEVSTLLCSQKLTPCCRVVVLHRSVAVCREHDRTAPVAVCRVHRSQCCSLSC